jgi:D-sedoheptulose 7-phosphate isomerase
MSRVELLRERIDEALAVIAQLRSDQALHAAVDDAAEAIVEAVRAGGRVLLCGNGGSAADAQHLAAEFIGRFMLDRQPLSAIALADNAAALTAIGNDYCFEDTFARGVRAHGRPGDILIALSTSGQSLNVVRALEAARAVGMATVAFVGPGSSPVAQSADTVISVGGPSIARIQEGHKLLGHTLFEIAERELCG